MSGVRDLPLAPEEKLMNCESNRMDNTFDMETLLDEQSRVHDESEDVDIIQCTNSCANGLVESECQDATENSSSFENTVSGIEDCSMSNDTEVESQLCCPNTSTFDEVGEAFQPRKKRLTDHWRKFIRPLLWRCKWIELQVKEFKSQAAKYDKELAEYNKVKHLMYERGTLEGFDSKTLPFYSQIQRKKVMKRVKRKRVEETADISSYLSQHNLFSYYENRRLGADAPLDDFCGNIEKTVSGNDELGLEDGWPSLEFWNDHNSTEPILRKIDEVCSQIGKLRTRVDKVLSEHIGKFCSINKLSSLVPYDASNGSDQNLASPKNGERVPVRLQNNSPHPLSDSKKEDLPMPKSTCSSHGEVTPLPNMMDFTDQHHVMGSYGDEENDILIDNQEGKEVLHNFETMGSQLIKKPEAAKEKPASLLCGGSSEQLLPTSKSNAPQSRKRNTRR